MSSIDYRINIHPKVKIKISFINLRSIETSKKCIGIKIIVCRVVGDENNG